MSIILRVSQMPKISCCEKTLFLGHGINLMLKLHVCHAHNVDATPAARKRHSAIPPS